MPDVQLFQHELLMRRIHPEGFRTIGTRQIHRTERNCTNCARESECYASEELVRPGRFVLRSNWNPDNYIPYMKSIHAGICGSFINSDPELEARRLQSIETNLEARALRRAERAQEAVKEEKQWED
jgi:hypothetical protein